MHQSVDELIAPINFLGFSDGSGKSADPIESTAKQASCRFMPQRNPANCRVLPVLVCLATQVEKPSYTNTQMLLPSTHYPHRIWRFSLSNSLRPSASHSKDVWEGHSECSCRIRGIELKKVQLEALSLLSFLTPPKKKKRKHNAGRRSHKKRLLHLPAPVLGAHSPRNSCNAPPARNCRTVRLGPLGLRHEFFVSQFAVPASAKVRFVATDAKPTENQVPQQPENKVRYSFNM